VRPLYPYLGRSGVFNCPADKGLVHRTVGDPDRMPLKSSLYSTIGCSYQYNGDSCLPFLTGGGYRQEPAGLLPGQIESWVQEPAMYIMMYEPPARMWCGKETGMWSQWHYSLGVSDIEDPLYARQSFISPALFVDGHVSVHNFTKALTADIYFPYERTKDWVWYQPLSPPPLGEK
jgi:hypothetical protein